MMKIDLTKKYTICGTGLAMLITHIDEEEKDEVEDILAKTVKVIKSEPAWLNDALNSGDGTYGP